ncbi:MAG: phosphoglucosamine mutase [Bacteroidota bacterium]
MALMISVSGIRGVFGTDLNPENLARFTAAYGSWVGSGKVVVGRDSRVTGELCERIVISTLQSVGIDVVTVGIAPTPTVAMAVLKHEAQGGIIISASHNPAEWNALKLLNEKSEFLDADQGEAVIELSEQGNFNYQLYDNIGSVSPDDQALDYHIQKILDLPYIDRDTIAKAGFTVALDAVNGAGSHALPTLLEELGVEVHKMYCEPNGLFPHEPEPLPENLEDICSFVKQHEVDLGIVVDPDADRLALVDDQGNLFGEEYTQAMAFDFILSQKNGSCCTNLSSSRVVDDIAKQHNQKCWRSAVGEINVVKRMQEKAAIIGGEGNGGVINPDLHYGRDSLVGTAMMLQLMAERSVSSSEYRAQFPDYQMIKSKLPLDGIDADAILKTVQKTFRNEELSTIDGVKIDFEEGWVHLRKSNTEPILRIYAEAKDEATAEALVQKVKDSF